MTFLFTLVLDRVVGWVLRPPGLIYPPGSVAHYQTFEYQFTARINRLGFRDREFVPVRNPGCRVMVLGDSFTYGWGVELSQCWVKILEGNLRKKGLALEMANLGKPGGDPAYYASLAERAIRKLRPQVVVVAVLQGDDLISLKYGKQFPSFWDGVGRLLYPNTFKAPRGAYKVISQEETRREYRQQAEKILKGLQCEAKKRFEGLDGLVKQVFLQGDLNPAAINMALKHPDYFGEPLRLDDPEIAGLVGVMAAHFGSINRTAWEYGARVVIVSVPNDIYVSEVNLRNREKMGYRVSAAMLITEAPDEAIRQAGGRAGLPVIEVTAIFREAAKGRQLYFPYDGHFTPAGHQLFAEALTPMVEKYLELQQPCQAMTSSGDYSRNWD